MGIARCFKCLKLIDGPMCSSWEMAMGAVIFQDLAAYGSRLYDAGVDGINVRIVVCDECLEHAKNWLPPTANLLLKEYQNGRPLEKLERTPELSHRYFTPENIYQEQAIAIIEQAWGKRLENDREKWHDPDLILAIAEALKAKDKC